MEMYGEENIISAVIYVDDNAHSHCDLAPLAKRGNYRRKNVDRRQKEDAQDAREIS